MRIPRLHESVFMNISDPMYPAGVSDRDFDMPDGQIGKHKEVVPPTTTMVYCPTCMRHWKAPANDQWWKARIETCEEHKGANQ